MRSYEYGCDWPVALSLPTGEDWDSGLYLATFSIPGTRARTRVPFVVKGAADSRAPRLMALNFTTYQAYNYWGGRSLYGAIDRSGQRDWNEGHRSTRVSFNRPFLVDRTSPGENYYHTPELPFIQWMERNDFDVDFCSDVDLHEGPGSPLRLQTLDHRWPL